MRKKEELIQSKWRRCPKQVIYYLERDGKSLKVPVGTKQNPAPVLPNSHWHNASVLLFLQCVAAPLLLGLNWWELLRQICLISSAWVTTHSQPETSSGCCGHAITKANVRLLSGPFHFCLNTGVNNKTYMHFKAEDSLCHHRWKQSC